MSATIARANSSRVDYRPSGYGDHEQDDADGEEQGESFPGVRASYPRQVDRNRYSQRKFRTARNTPAAPQSATTASAPPVWDRPSPVTIEALRPSIR